MHSPDKPFTMMLRDYGTLDTVFECSRCHRVETFTYDPSPDWTYDEFVADCRNDATDAHQCPVDPDIRDILNALRTAGNALERAFLLRGIDSPYAKLAHRVDEIWHDIAELQVDDARDIDPERFGEIRR